MDDAMVLTIGQLVLQATRPRAIEHAVANLEGEVEAASAAPVTGDRPWREANGDNGGAGLVSGSRG